MGCTWNPRLIPITKKPSQLITQTIINQIIELRFIKQNLKIHEIWIVILVCFLFFSLHIHQIGYPSWQVSSNHFLPFLFDHICTQD